LSLDAPRSHFKLYLALGAGALALLIIWGLWSFHRSEFPPPEASGGGTILSPNPGGSDNPLLNPAKPLRAARGTADLAERRGDALDAVQDELTGVAPPEEEPTP
jgi:hypothetical protein